MTNLVLVTPEQCLVPLSKDRYSNGYSTTYLSLYPYRNEESITRVINHFGIKVPFVNIISKYDGRSKCPDCGAIYSGTQPMCTKEVRKIKIKEISEWYSSDFWKHSEEGLFKGSKFKTKDKTFDVLEVKESAICEGRLIWDLEKQFEEQVSFFDMVLKLEPVLRTQTELAKYADCFLPGVREHIEQQLMRQELLHVSAAIAMHKGALEQIANKMNTAGHALSFGF